MELKNTIASYAHERGIQRETLQRWQELSAADQSALLVLARALRLGQNHFRDVLDWSIEISLRDDMSIAAILAADTIGLVVRDSHLGRNDRLKHVKESLRRLRFPRLTRIEGEIQKRLRALKTDPRISISVAPGLEGGVKVELSAHSSDNLEQLALEVAAIAREEKTRGVFDLLIGSEDATL